MTIPDPHTASQHTVERAAAGILLAFERFGADVDTTSPAFLLEVGRALAPCVVEARPALEAYIRRAHDRVREKDVTAGWDLAVDALMLAAGRQAALTAQLVSWSARQAGLAPAEVVWQVLNDSGTTGATDGV